MSDGSVLRIEGPAGTTTTTTTNDDNNDNNDDNDNDTYSNISNTSNNNKTSSNIDISKALLVALGDPEQEAVAINNVNTHYQIY